MLPRTLLRTAVLLLVGVALGVAINATTARATHTTITGSTYSYYPYQQNWNGYKVYLSAPTHRDSGRRGELGWEENINGRHWNYYAANGSYSWGSYNTTDYYRNIRARGYHVAVSGNSRDDGYIAHRDFANNWGADVYISTHTNAGGGRYSLYMTDRWTAGSLDNKLRNKLASIVGSYPIPGGEVESTDATGYTSNRNLAELDARAAANVYVELIFHDNRDHINWFGSGSNWAQSVTTDARRYGWAIDLTLGYPRA